MDISSGNLLHSYWKWPLIVSFPIFSHENWWFSIVMLIYRRVIINFGWKNCGFLHFLPDLTINNGNWMELVCIQISDFTRVNEWKLMESLVLQGSFCCKSIQDWRVIFDFYMRIVWDISERCSRFNHRQFEFDQSGFKQQRGNFVHRGWGMKHYFHRNVSPPQSVIHQYSWHWLWKRRIQKAEIPSVEHHLCG